MRSECCEEVEQRLGYSTVARVNSGVFCLSQLQRTEESYIGVAYCNCKAGSGSSTLLVADRMWLL